MTRTRTLGPLLVLLFTLSGCGDDSDSGATDSTSSTTEAATATTEDAEVCDANYPTNCVDEDVISYCVDGLVETESCFRFCTEDGIGGVTSPNGHCHDDIPEETACHCCSPDDGTDCPM